MMINSKKSGNILYELCLVNEFYRQKYSKGEMLTSEVKQILIDVLTKIIVEHQVISLKYVQGIKWIGKP